MNASFDGARIRLSAQFNALAATSLDQQQHDILVGMREVIGMMLCMYDPAIENDCADLSDEVNLVEVPDVPEDEEDEAGQT